MLLNAFELKEHLRYKCRTELWALENLEVELKRRSVLASALGMSTR